METVILLITGAWHVPEHYQLLISKLQDFIVECPRLMTNNNAVPPNSTLDDDVQQIRDITMEHLNKGRNVIAVMHSYGGMVGSAALAGLPNTPGKVKALIYMAAFVPLENDSLAGIFGGSLPPWLTTNEKGTIDIDDPGTHFYANLCPEEQAKWTKLLVEHPKVAQYEPAKTKYGPPAWQTIPATYLFCRGDQGLIFPVQEMMVDRVEKQVPKTKFLRKYCDADHSPFLSMPERVVEIVKEKV